MRSNPRKCAHPSRSEVGFLLLNGSFKPIYSNPEALQILAYPESPGKLKNGSQDSLLPEEIRSGLQNHRSLPQSHWLTEFRSGKRCYRLKAFSLNSHSQNSSQPTVALLIERSAQESIDLSQIAEQFHLTQREREAVGYLVQGLKSKEIAHRMKVSPHTVKAFLRLVMIKMGVSNRSGIIGKLLKTLP